MAEIRSKKQFLALQEKYGYDTKIAKAMGITKGLAARIRNRYEIPPLPRGRGMPHYIDRNPKPTMTDKEMAKLFKGRRFLDVGEK